MITAEGEIKERIKDIITKKKRAETAITLQGAIEKCLILLSQYRKKIIV